MRSGGKGHSATGNSAVLARTCGTADSHHPHHTSPPVLLRSEATEGRGGGGEGSCAGPPVAGALCPRLSPGGIGKVSGDRGCGRGGACMRGHGRSALPAAPTSLVDALTVTMVSRSARPVPALNRRASTLKLESTACSGLLPALLTLPSPCCTHELYSCKAPRRLPERRGRPVDLRQHGNHIASGGWAAALRRDVQCKHRHACPAHVR